MRSEAWTEWTLCSGKEGFWARDPILCSRVEVEILHTGDCLSQHQLFWTKPSSWCHYCVPQLPPVSHLMVVKSAIRARPNLPPQFTASPLSAHEASRAEGSSTSSGLVANSQPTFSLQTQHQVSRSETHTWGTCSARPPLSHWAHLWSTFVKTGIRWALSEVPIQMAMILLLSRCLYWIMTQFPRHML